MTQVPCQQICFSVVLICYNQEQHIEAAIDSVLAQTAIDKVQEIIVVDDCSTDGSVRLVEAIAKTNSKLRLLRRTTNSGGGSAPRNDGIYAATGTHVALLDGDDIWLPEKLEAQLGALEAHPEIGLLFSDFRVFDDETGVEKSAVARHYDARDPNALRDFFVHGGPAIPSCSVISREAIERVGGFNTDIRFNEETEYWLRIAAVLPIHHQPLELMRKRDWFGSIGSAKYGLENLESKRAMTAGILERVPSLADLVEKRDAQIEFKTAVHHFAQGDTAKGRAHLRSALKLDRGLKKARLYLLVSYLSANPQALLDFLRTARTYLPVGLR
ncbi:MAG: glycosyltransferase family 2 protein [Pseudomonadota bacterium]